MNYGEQKHLALFYEEELNQCKYYPPQEPQS
jgi:hypothetical protein